MLDISKEFPASVSAGSLLTVSRAMKLGLVCIKTQHVQMTVGRPLPENDTKLHFSLKWNNTWQTIFIWYLGIICTFSQKSDSVVTWNYFFWHVWKLCNLPLNYLHKTIKFHLLFYVLLMYFVNWLSNKWVIYFTKCVL